MKKARTELLKNAEKKSFQKSKRSDIKYFFCIYCLTETTQKCANFASSLLVLDFFLNHLSDLYSQRLNCTNLKDELYRSPNGGGGVYLLQSELSYSTR